MKSYKNNMDAKSLMIGDWVKSDYGYSKVYYLNGSCNAIEYYCFDEDGRETGRRDSLDSVEPIPLTEEILGKNGFVGDTRSAFAYNKGNVYLINLHAEVGEMDIYDEKGHDSSGYVCRSVNVPSLMCVHELQRALRLCGLNDLADNFKIE